MMVRSTATNQVCPASRDICEWDVIRYWKETAQSSVSLW